MYILNVSFIKPADEVAPHIPTHSAWVTKYFAEGLFLMAGPKKSKLGGVIITKSMDKKLLMKILAEDSYVIEDVAEYQIIDIDCKVSASGLELLIGA
jgi:uncharacterized protein YciI